MKSEAKVPAAAPNKANGKVAAPAGGDDKKSRPKVRRNAENQMEFVRMALTLAARPTVDHLLYLGDLPLSPELLKGRPKVRKKLVQAAVSEVQREVIRAMEIEVLPLPPYDLGRSEKLKLALVSGTARGVFKPGETVLALSGARPTEPADSMLLIEVGEAGPGPLGSCPRVRGISAEVLDPIIELAASVGAEGLEGRPMGALFVIGDSNHVMENSRQLSLNPFQGYSEDERNLVNPLFARPCGLFCVDGASWFGGTGLCTAGRYLNFEQADIKVPLGLGARHMAAAGISLETEALAIVVSQTSGRVRVFRKGQTVLELSPRKASV